MAEKKYPDRKPMIKKKKIYLCGPIDSRCVADVPREQIVNRFKMWELYFKHLGFDVVNPIEFGEELKRDCPSLTLNDIMAEEIEELKLPEMTHMFLMEKWHYSMGCITEHLCAGRRQYSEGVPMMKFISYDSAMVDAFQAERLLNDYLEQKHKEELIKHNDNKDECR